MAYPDSKPTSLEIYDKNKNKEKPIEEIYDKIGKKLDKEYRKIESDLPIIDVFYKNENKLNDPYINAISCLPQTILTDKNKNRLNRINK